MSEGQPLRQDDPVENMQDYIAERLTTGTQTDNLQDDTRTLEQELADLQALQEERAGANPRPDVDTLIEQAQTRVDRMRLRQNEQLDMTTDTQVNVRELTPEAEARAQIAERTRRETGMGNIKP